MNTVSIKPLTKSQLFKLFNVQQLPPATIGACDFMQLLDDIHKHYVVPVRAECETYYAKPVVEVPQKIWRTKYEYTFGDGVYVKSMRELRNTKIAQVFIVFNENTQSVFVSVLDYRFAHDGRPEGYAAKRFSQFLDVPHDFFRLLLRMKSNRHKYSREHVKRHVAKELATQGIELHTFDLLAKLKTLLAVCEE